MSLTTISVGGGELELHDVVDSNTSLHYSRYPEGLMFLLFH